MFEECNIHKWTQERLDKASDETMNKAYALYKRHELNEKSKKTGKTLGKHVINLYFTGISRLLKIKDVKNYAKILKMIRSSKIKWLAWVAFSVYVW